MQSLLGRILKHREKTEIAFRKESALQSCFQNELKEQVPFYVLLMQSMDEEQAKTKKANNKQKKMGK